MGDFRRERSRPKPQPLVVKPSNNGAMDQASCRHPSWLVAGAIPQFTAVTMPGGQQVVSPVPAGYHFYCSRCLTIKKVMLAS